MEDVQDSAGITVAERFRHAWAETPILKGKWRQMIGAVLTAIFMIIAFGIWGSTDDVGAELLVTGSFVATAVVLVPGEFLFHLLRARGDILSQRLVEAGTTIKDLETTRALPIQVTGVRAVLSSEGIASVLLVGVANYGDKVASGVEVTVMAENNGSTVELQEPPPLKLPPFGSPEWAELDGPISLSASLTVSGTVAHGGEVQTYCYRYREWSDGDRPEGVRQFEPCDHSRLRKLGMTAFSGAYAITGADADLIHRDKDSGVVGTDSETN